MRPFKFTWINFSCLGLMCLITHEAHSQVNQAVPLEQSAAVNAPQGGITPAVPLQQPTMQGQGLQQNLQSLLNEHGVLLNQAIVSALNNALPEVIESGKIRLFRNSNAIANLLASLYGPEAGRTFENLFNQHIIGGSQYINATKMGNLNLANQISVQALANGRQLAEFFSRLGPSIPLATWQKMFDDHVKIEAEQTKAYFQGNINRAIQLRDESLVQLGELANIIATALAGGSIPQANG